MGVGTTGPALGEGGISPETGIFYPWVCEVLARHFGGLVLEPEHRFYGESLPYGPASYEVEHLKGATWSLEDGDGSKFGPLKKWLLIYTPNNMFAGYH